MRRPRHSWLPRPATARTVRNTLYPGFAWPITHLVPLGAWRRYENGFLFADADEAFVLETAGVHHWACERVGPGQSRYISNDLSIRSAIDSCSAGIQQLCKSNGWWDGRSLFDWKVFTACASLAPLLPLHPARPCHRD